METDGEPRVLLPEELFGLASVQHLVLPLVEVPMPALAPLMHLAGHLETLAVSHQGGPGSEYGFRIARDPAGNLYMAGYAYTGN